MARRLTGKRTRRLRATAALALGGLVASCGQSGDTIDVFAAASLTDALTEVAAEYAETSTGEAVRLNFAGTSALREQLLDGAQGDVFVSANDEIMQDLVARGVVHGSPVVIATNRLVLAVPAGNPGDVSAISDLGDSDLFVGLCAVGVPCGDLAAEALDAAGVEAVPDTTESDVRALTARLVDRELDVALVYASDVVSAGDDVAEIPAAGVPDAAVNRYPIAAVDRGDAQAQAFIDFVAGPRGAEILNRWGFGSP